MKFRKKPVVIDAIQFTGGAEAATPIIDWILNGGHTATYRPEREERFAANGEQSQMFEPEHIRIRTLEGIHQGIVGDWIIRGVAGEFYPCKPDIFAATYEAVLDSENA
jgi:hypothetical protein